MTAPAATSMAGGEPAGRLGQVSWALFDWANQPFFTLVTTFIFAPYFTAIVVGDATEGQALWGYAQAAAGAAIALLSPVLGSIADASGPRKPWIFAFQALCVAACWMLWYALPGAPDGIPAILVAVVVATIAAEFSIVFNNAMLPSLTSEDRIGRLSGYAWALGYAGGLVTLFFVLLAFSLPETPMFGLDKASHEHDRIVGPLSAVWIVVFVVPLFLFTPDAPASGLAPAQAVGAGLRRIAATLGHLRDYRMIGLFLLASASSASSSSSSPPPAPPPAAGSTTDWGRNRPSSSPSSASSSPPSASSPSPPTARRVATRSSSCFRSTDRAAGRRSCRRRRSRSSSPSASSSASSAAPCRRRAGPCWRAWRRPT
jgi:MFS family permease